jgi:hypothetical protein
MALGAPCAVRRTEGRGTSSRGCLRPYPLSTVAVCQVVHCRAALLTGSANPFSLNAPQHTDQRAKATDNTC